MSAQSKARTLQRMNTKGVINLGAWSKVGVANR
jgi:hypothetical protein